MMDSTAQIPRRHAAAGDGLQAFPAFQNFPNSPKVQVATRGFESNCALCRDARPATVVEMTMIAFIITIDGIM